LARVKRVRLAYDADEAGERAAERDAARLRQAGIEVFRIQFPWGMDANEYARKVTPGRQSLALLINSAAWLGQANQARPGPTVAASPPAEALKHVARGWTNRPAIPCRSSTTILTTGVGWAPAPFYQLPCRELSRTRPPLPL
jgi:hypothetical protein